MRIRSALFGLMMATATASCAFLLDFDELQAGAGVDGGAGSAPVPLDQLAPSYADALCERIDRCVGALAPFVFGDEDCRDYITKTLGQSEFAELGMLPPDKFEYHPEKTPACLEAVRNAPCDVLIPIPVECEEAIKGLVGQDGECTHPAECMRGLYCALPTGVCPGTCQPKPGEGQACANGACVEGLQCDSATSTCVVPADEGQPCEGGTSPRCRLDKTCLDKDTGKEGTCRANATLYTLGNGVGCDWKIGGLCEKGQFCELESLAKVQAGEFSGTCIGQLAPDSPCTLSLPDACAPGQYCRITIGIDGTCTPLPTPGEPCAVNALKALCAAGSRCLGRDDVNPNLTPGNCVATAGLTYGCSGNAVCYSNHCESGKCAPPNYCAP